MKVSIIGGGGRVGSNAAFALQCAGIVSEIHLQRAGRRRERRRRHSKQLRLSLSRRTGIVWVELLVPLADHIVFHHVMRLRSIHLLCALLATAIPHGSRMGVGDRSGRLRAAKRVSRSAGGII